MPIIFAEADILSEKNPFLESIFIAKRTNYTYITLRVQDFANGKNFLLISNLNKEFFVFSPESYFIKAIENFFPVFA